MKKTLTSLSIATALTLSASAALAGNHYRYDQGGYDRAKVTHVDPIYHEVRVATPVRECYETRDYRHSGHQSYTGTIAGGIIGGVIGNQFGGGRGNTVMTVAGTLLGGSVGRDVTHRNQSRGQGYREQCQVSQRYHYERHIEGYDVHYRYKGRNYTTFMDHHPGKFIPVDVIVKPAYRSSQSTSRRYY